MSRFDSAGSSFWDERYRAASFPYGTEPSRTTAFAIDAFHEHGARRVLVAGCGSGRHVLAFATAGFDVVGFDVSPVAVTLARESLAMANLRATIEVRDVLAADPFETAVDAVFA